MSRRTGGKEYGKSAFSFKYASGDAKVHKNLVDVFYNKCGLVHVNMYGGSKSRVVDLGKTALKKVTKAPLKGWLKKSFVPRVGHTYVQEVIEENWARDGRKVRVQQKMLVKYTVLALNDNHIKLAWAPLDSGQKWDPDPKTGGAGVMGMCGGKHDPR